MPSALASPSDLPAHLAQVVWRGGAVGRAPEQVLPTGHPALDTELPGGGWPCQTMTEILQAQLAQAEWRLLGPALAQLVRQGGSILLIGPPHPPHLPGLSREGVPAERLVRIDAQTPLERLWATEQALKAGCVSAILSWLPQVRPEQVRRLQACAARHPGPFFVFRPARVQAEASAAPLRLRLDIGDCPHPLRVEVLKRRGPQLARPLHLPHWPAGLAPLLPPPAIRPPGSPDASDHPPSSPPFPHTATPPSHHAALDRLAAWGPPHGP